MSLYPSLEDLKVDKVIQAQTAFSANPANPAILAEASAPISQDGNLYPKLYPELSQYMGLSLNEEEVRANMALVPGASVQGIAFWDWGYREEFGVFRTKRAWGKGPWRWASGLGGEDIAVSAGSSEGLRRRGWFWEWQ
ncbi:syntenin-1 [Hyaena hyaena]|uniref:syntenin-1 n=1 Tax=Hyaena hyaena TaxID=95912 RepID=UPI0019234443|nr:syntenin-1 [Hyaena hyaena]